MTVSAQTAAAREPGSPLSSALKWGRSDKAPVLAGLLAEEIDALVARVADLERQRGEAYQRGIKANEGRVANANRERDAAVRVGDNLRDALSWALDVLDLCFKRLDSIDTYSDEHMALRAAGLAKARAALAAAVTAEPPAEEEK